ncbi:hypothetical protein GX48_07678 [Paracoccidioides brasiliensis]|nr:hypothetical protein GX48_07678 [Paracoccidioides brasiliensis]
MNINNNDDDNDDSNDTVFNFSRKTDLTDSIDYRKDSKNNISNLTNLLADDKHLSDTDPGPTCAQNDFKTDTAVLSQEETLEEVSCLSVRLSALPRPGARLDLTRRPTGSAPDRARPRPGWLSVCSSTAA